MAQRDPLDDRSYKIGPDLVLDVFADILRDPGDPPRGDVLRVNVPSSDRPGAYESVCLDIEATRHLLCALSREVLAIASPSRPRRIDGPIEDYETYIVIHCHDDTMLRVPWPPGRHFDPDAIEWYGSKGWEPALSPKERSDAQD